MNFFFSILYLFYFIYLLLSLFLRHTFTRSTSYLGRNSLPNLPLFYLVEILVIYRISHINIRIHYSSCTKFRYSWYFDHKISYDFVWTLRIKRLKQTFVSFLLNSFNTIVDTSFSERNWCKMEVETTICSLIWTPQTQNVILISLVNVMNDRFAQNPVSYTHLTLPTKA